MTGKGRRKSAAEHARRPRPTYRGGNSDANHLREQLIAARDEHHSKNHPYISLWAQGKLTRAQMAVYVMQHYHSVSDYLN